MEVIVVVLLPGSTVPLVVDLAHRHHDDGLELRVDALLVVGAPSLPIGAVAFVVTVLAALVAFFALAVSALEVLGPRPCSLRFSRVLILEAVAVLALAQGEVLAFCFGTSDIYLISVIAGLCAHPAAEWMWRVAGHTWSCLRPALDELFYLLVHRNLVDMLQLQAALDLLVVGGQALHHHEDAPRVVDGVPGRRRLASQDFRRYTLIG